MRTFEASPRYHTIYKYRYNAVVPLTVLYTLSTDIMFNQFLLCQMCKFSIPIGYELIFKISLMFAKQNCKHDVCSCISNIYITQITFHGPCMCLLNVFGRVFRWPICFYNLWNRIAGLLPARIIGFINQFARGWVYITCNEDSGNTFT